MSSHSPHEERTHLDRFFDALNKALMEAERRHGTNVQRLATELNLSESSVYAYFDGTRIPPIRNLDRMMAAMKVPPRTKGELATLRDAAAQEKRINARKGLPAPMTLPGEPDHFVGRKQELEKLDEFAREMGAGPIVISAVSGTAGVGKTALAVHWSVARPKAFPDGRLFVDLLGYDPGGPLDTSEALAVLLEGLGVEPSAIPRGQAARVAKYRAETAKRNMLIVLDNAQTPEHVRALLPGGSTCLLIVTSRDSLGGLVALNGARRIDLDVLPVEDSKLLLRRIIGSAVDSDPAAADALVAACERLPLALRIAAEKVSADPRLSIPEHVAELAHERRRLDFLGYSNDPRAALRAVFSWSYGHLPEEAQRFFRLVGLSPAVNHDIWGLAALAGTGSNESRSVARQLFRASLVQEPFPRRFQMHSLLRTYGGELAFEVDPVQARESAIGRLAQHYLAGSFAAACLISGSVLDVGFPVAAPGGPQLPDTASSLEWMAAEYRNVVLVCRRAEDFSVRREVVGLARSMHRYLDSRGHFGDALTLAEAGRRAAEVSGDMAGQTECLNLMGLTRLRSGEYQEAIGYFDQVAAFGEATGDTWAQARAIGNRGLTLDRMGRYEEALDHHERALVLHTNDGDLLGIANDQGNRGNTLESLGRYPEAIECQRKALELYETVVDRRGIANTVNNLGVLYYQLGQYEPALEQFRHSLQLKRQSGDRLGERNTLMNIGISLASLERDAEAVAELEAARLISEQLNEPATTAQILNSLASVRRAMGEHLSAVAEHEQALRVAETIGDVGLQAEVLNDLAMTQLAAGRIEPATSGHQRAVRLALECKNPYQEARGYHGIGNALVQAGKVREAVAMWLAARELFVHLNTAQVALIDEKLAEYAGDA